MSNTKQSVTGTNCNMNEVLQNEINLHPGINTVIPGFSLDIGQRVFLYPNGYKHG